MADFKLFIASIDTCFVMEHNKGAFHYILGKFEEFLSIRESTFIMPRWGMKMLRGGAPKYFLALKRGSESSRYTEGGAPNVSKFWSSRGLECSLPP